MSVVPLSACMFTRSREGSVAAILGADGNAAISFSLAQY